MITRTDLNWWLGLEPKLDWQFATTYADGAPHEYVASPRTEGLDAGDYARAAHVIQTFGEPMKFHKWTRIYLRTPMGWKHWTMDADLDDTNLVNRGRAGHVYGIQNMPMTRAATDSPYDPFASTWDKNFALTGADQSQLTEFIGTVFGDKLWRTLDVGCGTGWPVTSGLVEPVRYVGIDPSTAMLNALVAKHPILAGVHPMSWREATRQRVLCGTRFDTVLSLHKTQFPRLFGNPEDKRRHRVTPESQRRRERNGRERGPLRVVAFLKNRAARAGDRGRRPRMPIHSDSPRSTA